MMAIVPAVGEAGLRSAWAKSMRLLWKLTKAKNKRNKQGGSMTQVVEHLPSKASSLKPISKFMCNKLNKLWFDFFSLLRKDILTSECSVQNHYSQF
jgi:hypothetical protein